MARFYHAQTNFTSGEISPKMKGRSDTEEYRRGVETLNNLLVTSTGGLEKRPGMEFKEATTRVDSNGTLKTIHIPYDIGEGREYYVAINYDTSNPGSDSRSITVFGGSGDTKAFVGAGNTSISSADLTSVATAGSIDPYGFHYTQAGSYLMIVHNSGGMRPLLITPLELPNLTGSVKFQAVMLSSPTTILNPFSSGNPKDNPWNTPCYLQVPMSLPNNDTSFTMSVSSGTGSGTITASEPFFYETMFGERFTLDDKSGTPTNIITVRITGTSGTAGSPSTTATYIVEGLMGTYPTGTPTDYWYEQSWSQRKGWPKSITSYEGRFYYGGTTREPTKLWASSAELISNLNLYFNPASNLNSMYSRAPEGSSLTFSFALNQGSGDNSISWIGESSRLTVGTVNKIFILEGKDAPISQVSPPVVSMISSRGSAPYMPITSRDSLFCLSRDRKSIYQVVADRQRGYFARDVLEISDDLIHRGKTNRDTQILRLVKTNSPSSIWFLADDNQAYQMALGIEENTFGLSRHPSDVEVHDIFPLREESTNREYVYAFGEHTGNVDTDTDYLFKLHIKEYMWETLDPNNSVQYLDHWRKAITIDIAGDIVFAASTLKSKTVTIIVGGDIVENVALDANGNAVLSGNPYPAGTDFIVGLPYESKLETLPLEVGPNVNYSSRGDIFRIDTIHLELYRSFLFQFGSNNDGEEILYDADGLDLVAAISKNLELQVPSSTSNETKIVVQSNKPVPVNILRLIMRGQNYAG